MDFDIRVAFVILQADVVLGPVALDQVHFQDQGFQLRADHDPLEVGDLAHQAAGLVVVAGIGVEIGAHPVLEIDRLANVNDRPGGVFHNVAAGFGREGIEDALNMLGNFHGSDYKRWNILNPQKIPKNSYPALGRIARRQVLIFFALQKGSACGKRCAPSKRDISSM